MKRGLWILSVAILAGVIGFFATRIPCPCATDSGTAPHSDKATAPELEWLRREFHLSEAEFEKASALHLAYLPACETLCIKVAAANAKVRSLSARSNQLSEEMKAALAESAALRVECQTAMLKHLYQTAACMPPAQGQRYLEFMLPEVLAMPNHSNESTPKGH